MWMILNQILNITFHYLEAYNERVPFAVYGSSGDQSRKNKPTSETRRAVPIVEVYHYSSTNPMFLLLTVSLL